MSFVLCAVIKSGAKIACVSFINLILGLGKFNDTNLFHLASSYKRWEKIYGRFTSDTESTINLFLSLPLYLSTFSLSL